MHRLRHTFLCPSAVGAALLVSFCFCSFGVLRLRVLPGEGGYMRISGNTCGVANKATFPNLA